VRGAFGRSSHRAGDLPPIKWCVCLTIVDRGAPCGRPPPNSALASLYGLRKRASGNLLTGFFLIKQLMKPRGSRALTMMLLCCSHGGVVDEQLHHSRPLPLIGGTVDWPIEDGVRPADVGLATAEPVAPETAVKLFSSPRHNPCGSTSASSSRSKVNF